MENRLSTYRKDGSTEFRFGEGPIGFKSISFVVSYDHDDDQIPGTLMKHGDNENIARYWDRVSEKYKQLEMQDPFLYTRHFVVDVTKYALEDLDEINKCIEITGYIGKFLKERDLIPPAFDDFEIIE